MTVKAEMLHIKLVAVSNIKPLLVSDAKSNTDQLSSNVLWVGLAVHCFHLLLDAVIQ